jgi:hypothetical protein
MGSLDMVQCLLVQAGGQRPGVNTETVAGIKASLLLLRRANNKIHRIIALLYCTEGQYQ